MEICIWVTSPAWRTKKDEQLCVNCKHYYQHYVYYRFGGLTPTHAGHCVYPRLKNREASDTCKHFERKEE